MTQSVIPDLGDASPPEPGIAGRARLRHNVKDAAGNSMESVAVDVFQPGTTSPLPLFTTRTGDISAPNPLISNEQGEVEAWLASPQSVDLRVTDNGGTAHYSGQPLATWSFAPFTENLDVYASPDAAAGDHPDLAAHDTLGLATQTELDAHVDDAVAHGGEPHPDLATHDALGLATQADLDTHKTSGDHDAAYVNEADHTKAAHDALNIDAETLDGLDSTAFETPAGAQAKVDLHILDVTDAHDASAIGLLDSAGNFTATNVEDALAELHALSGGGLVASERVLMVGKAGAIGATETDCADFLVVVPFGMTLKRIKVTRKTHGSAASVVQIRRSIDSGATFANAFGAATFGASALVAISDPGDLDIDEGDLLNFSVVTGGGTSFMVELIGEERAASVWGAGMDVVISEIETITGDQEAATVTILPDAELIFAPTSDVSLTVTGSVRVQGKLTMRPASASIDHSLIFDEIDEADFQGGGMEPDDLGVDGFPIVDTDIGLWADSGGILALVGTTKLGWGRATATLAAAATTATLDRTPTGWQIGDTVIVAPTADPSVANYWTLYDERTIANIAGNVITFSSALTHAHPAVTIAAGVTYGAEIMNMTRNVRVEGTLGGRTHIFMGPSSGDHALDYMSTRYTGPRFGTDKEQFVQGRYSWHFHMMEDNLGPKTFSGLVARDNGGHSVVPHNTSDLTFFETVCHECHEDMFWWDPATSPMSIRNTFDRVLGSKLGWSSGTQIGRNARTNHFSVGDPNPALTSDRNTIKNSCMLGGMEGSISGGDASGYGWGEGVVGVWNFFDNQAHNNEFQGAFAWQNDQNDHELLRFHSWHNQNGISHGAYRNVYHFTDSILYRNKDRPLELNATGGKKIDPLIVPRVQEWNNVTFDGAGVNLYGVEISEHSLSAGSPVLFRDCIMKGYTTAAFHLRHAPTSDPDLTEWYDFVDCDMGAGPAIIIDTHAELIDADVYLKNSGGITEAMFRESTVSGGTLVPGFNAKQFNIPADVSSGMQLWLKAEDLDATLNDGDPVTTWSDASGNGFDATQAVALNKPTFKTSVFNGMPAVRFDGTGHYLNIDGLLLDPDAGPLTIFIVGKMNTGTGTRNMLSQRDGTGVGRTILSRDSNDRIASGWCSGFLSTEYVNEYEIWRFRKDDVPTMQLSRFMEEESGTSTYNSGPANGGWRLGASKTAGGFLDGDIMELIVFNRDLAVWEMRAWNSFLRHRYQFYSG